MNEDQVRVLRHNRPEIVRVLAGESDLNYILDRMEELGPRLEDGLEDPHVQEDGRPITDWMRENVRSHNKTVTEKVRQFLDELERRGPGAFWSFLEALKDQHGFLQRTLICSRTENDMRKYVSGDDLSSMSPHVVQIDDVNLPRTKGRSRSNSAKIKRPTFNDQENEEQRKRLQGRSISEPPDLSTQVKKALMKKNQVSFSEQRQSYRRSCDLAEIRRHFRVKALSQSELVKSTSNGKVRQRRCGLHHVTKDPVQDKTANTTSILHSLWGCIVYCLTVLVNIVKLCKTCTYTNPKLADTVMDVVPLVCLEKGDEVFLYIDQPPLATNQSKFLAVTKYGRHVLLPQGSFKRCNDPRGEEWFFPIEDDLPSVSEGQLQVILEGQPTGAFVVYKPEEPFSLKEDGVRHVYNLAVCYEHSIQTYHIYQYLSTELGFSGKEKYPNICTLVKYHGLNRGSISCRLRLPYSRSKFNIEDHIVGFNKIQLDNRDSEVIGIGYASEVKRVRNKDTGECVALKVPRPSDIESELVQLDFLEEIRHMLNFRNMNIVKSLGMYLTDGLVHIVMEYHPYGDVQRCLLQGTLSSDDTASMVEICEQTLSAVAYLKQRRVIHRDVAARNVLMVNPKLVHVKLTDFGMSRFVRKDCYMAEKNEVMALRWAAPEVLTHLHYSSKSDIWALGMFFYEVFSGGQEPYNTIADDQILVAVVDKKAVPEQPKCCPTALYNLMIQCWKFSPSARPEVDGLLRCVRRNCRTSPPAPPSTMDEGVQSEETYLGSRLENLYTLDSGSAALNVKMSSDSSLAAMSSASKKELNTGGGGSKRKKRANSTRAR